MKIRKAIEADWLAIQTICQETWLATYQNLYSPSYIEKVLEIFYRKERLIKDLTEMSDQWNGYWVAEIDGRPMGCIGGGIDEEGLAQIYVLYVRPQVQGYGIGKVLVACLTDCQKVSYGASRQGVTATEGNQIALPFYSKLGFQTQAIRENWIDPTEARDVYMTRKI